MSFKKNIIALSLLSSTVIAYEFNSNTSEKIDLFKSDISNIISFGTEEGLKNIILTEKDNTFEDELSPSQKEVVENIRTDILYDMDNYSVEKGDNIANIANNAGFSNYADLITLNSFLGVELKKHKRKKNVINIKVGDNLYIPREGSLEVVTQQLSKIIKIRKAIELNKKIELDDSDNIFDSISERIYPTAVQGIGIEKMLGGFIEAQKLVFDPYLPHIVDVEWEETVSCANLIRTLLAFSVDKNKLTDKEVRFFQKQGLDAWILPEALKQIGYVQKFDMMTPHFSEAKVGGRYPIKKSQQENYDSDLKTLGMYLDEFGIPGTILPLYYKYSNYQGVVSDYNKYRNNKHYNTHQTVLAGVDTISFDANSVGSISGGKINEFDESKDLTVFDFLVDFIQQRGDDSTAYADWQERVIEKKLLQFSELIKLKVNGEEVKLGIEFGKSNMLKIKASDIIELSGPIMIDGLHMHNSLDEDKRKNMNARTRFYFEFIIFGNYYVSELLEPGEGVLGIGDKGSNISSKLDTKGVYSLKSGDNVERVIKDRVLKYEKDRFEKLDKNDKNYDKKVKNLLNYYYSLQIKALKILGYMQSENEINPYSFNINAPIPYIDSSNINSTFNEYISKVKEDIKSPDRDVHIMKNYLKITTLPGDTYKRVLNRIKDDLLIHKNSNDSRFPNLHLFGEFNEILQRKFLEQFLNNSRKIQDIDSKKFLNGNILEGETLLIKLSDIDKIIGKLSQESYSPNLELDKVDEFAINFVVNVKGNKNIIENIAYLENYTPEGLIGKRRLAKQLLEYNPVLQQDISVFGKRIKSEISSHGDYQIRVFNLYKSLNEEWPNINHLNKSLSYFEKSEFIDYVNEVPDSYIQSVFSNLRDELTLKIFGGLKNPDKERIQSDLLIVKELQNKLSTYNEKLDKKEERIKIINDLYKLLVLDDGSGSNIVGKIVGTSLLNDKVNLHFQKFNGIIQASGEKIEDIYEDKKQMESYEKVILLINNLSESKVLYGLAENYIIRILSLLEEAAGKRYDYPVLSMTSGGQLVYGKNTFKKNILQYRKMTDGYREDLNRFHNRENPYYNELNILIDELTVVLDTFNEDSDKTYTSNKIFDLFSNEVFKKGLTDFTDIPKSNSLLPTEEEFSGTKFRNKFFRYINTRDIKRVGPGTLSGIIPKI